MPDAASPIQSAPPKRRWRKRWLIPAVVLAVLIGLFAGGYAWINRPQGRAEALLEKIRRVNSKNPGLFDQIRKRFSPKDAEPRSEETIVEDLANLGPEVIPTLAAALKDPSPKVRHFAAEALGEIGDPAATDALLDTLANNRSQDLREEVIDALGQIGDPRAAPALLGILSSEEDIALRGSAAWNLGQIGGPEAEPALVAALRFNSPDVRRCAAKGLGDIGDVAAVPDLILLLGDSDPQVRTAAATALGDLGDRRAVPALMAVIEDANSYARLEAVTAHRQDRRPGGPVGDSGGRR